jgi:5-carboxymethyl-2-hydroxymuconate isomerase
MPHIIVEYSDNLSDANIPTLLRSLHGALAAQGVDESRIKTRGQKLENYVIGTKGPDARMVHITLLLLEGRAPEVKKQLGQALYDVLKMQMADDKTALTLEVRDMAKDTYFM